MTAIAVHMVLPGREVGKAPVRARETIARFLERVGWAFTLPTICMVDGAPVLRRHWRRMRIKATSQIVFLSRPRGGAGTRGILGLVALITLSALAPWAGGLAATALGISSASSLFGAAFLAGGAFLVNALVSPKAGGQSESSDTLYSFGTQSNSARVLQAIPVSYGRVKKIPDYAAVPWSEFVGNDQYLNLLLVDGLGEYEREQILVDDTLLWDSTDGLSDSFSDVEIAFYGPGEEITLFPVNVATAVEVSGQELPDFAEDGWVGGFVANASGTTATALAMDIVFPGGCYSLNDSGDMQSRSVTITAEYRSIDSVGAATSDWSTLATATYTLTTKKPKRFSIKQSVSAGRYEVRMRRSPAPSTSSNTVDNVTWSGLRAFLTAPTSFPGVSVTAIRMKATQQLTSASAQKLGIVETRILPVWTGTAWEDQATRSPAWAAWDMATNTDYGARRNVSKMDLQAFIDLDATATSRGDRFDYEFTSAVGVPDALDTALRTVRAKHRWIGDILSLVRDEWRALPQMLLTDREIVRDSLSIEYQFAADDSTDAVVLEYVDETTWGAAEIQVPEDVTPEYPARIQIPGIVQRAQAYREAGFYWRQQYYRRVRPSLETEHDGRLLSYGSVVALQSELPATWGSSGAVVGVAGLVLALEPPPAWAVSGQHYVMLRDRWGGPFGPVMISRYLDDGHGVLDSADLTTVETQQGTTLGDVLARGDGAEHPSFALGVSSDWRRQCIVISGAPSGDKVSLSLVVDVRPSMRVLRSSGCMMMGAAPRRPSRPRRRSAFRKHRW